MSKKTKGENAAELSRRRFLQGAALTGAATVLPVATEGAAAQANQQGQMFDPHGGGAVNAPSDLTR